MRNQDLLHPDFVIETDAAIDDADSTQKLLAYNGHVHAINDRVLTNYTVSRGNGSEDDMNKLHSATNGNHNWARLLFHQIPRMASSGNNSSGSRSTLPTFDGTFAAAGEIYTVKTAAGYDVTRRTQDVPIRSIHRQPGRLQKPMIIYRESDRLPTYDNNAASSNGSDSSCSTDHSSWKMVMFDDDDNKKNNRQGRLHKRAASGCPTATKILYMVSLNTTKNII
jgi:hypothetical protein